MGNQVIVEARKVFRTGVQTLERETDSRGAIRHYVTIRNRTYYSRQQIPDEKIETWRRKLT